MTKKMNKEGLEIKFIIIAVAVVLIIIIATVLLLSKPSAEVEDEEFIPPPDFEIEYHHNETASEAEPPIQLNESLPGETSGTTIPLEWP